MCGSCDNDDMGEVNDLFGRLYSMGYNVSYEKTFNDILKQLRYDACFKPELRKYSIKLDEFTHEWMQYMTSGDIEDYRRPPDGCLPYRYVESNITAEQAKAMTLEELEKAVKDSYYAPEMDDTHHVKDIIRLPLFSSYIIRKHKLPQFQL
jgi:hypothetical protein